MQNDGSPTARWLARLKSAILWKSGAAKARSDPAAPYKIEKAWQEYLAPTFRKHGFKGSGRNFRQVINEIVLVINLQGSKYGGAFTVNLGAQPLAVPIGVGEVCDPASIKEYECAFRNRLSAVGRDTWWSYHDSRESMSDAAQQASRLFEARGMKHFQEQMDFILGKTTENFGRADPNTYVALVD